VHVNGVIWGAFSTLFIGLCHWVVPRLCGVRLWR
jgi:cytochrome c oxidase cbb3-type subunit 1